MHRSQDMGQIQRLGPQETRVSWVQGAGSNEATELFKAVALADDYAEFLTIPAYERMP
jgi:hypothetical protein